MSLYSVLAYDVAYNQLGILPASNLSFGSVLNGSGSISFSVTVPYQDPAGSNTPAPDQLELWTRPSKTLLFVDREGTLVWGGILWTRNRKQSRVWDITGQEFLSYFDHRIVPEPVGGGDLSYVGTFQFAALLCQIITDAQSVVQLGSLGDMGIVVPSPPTTPSFAADYLYNQFQMISSVISDMTSSQDLECYVSVAYVAGSPTPSLVVGVPICGRPVSTSGLTVNLANCPGSGYEWQENGPDQGLKVIEVGALPGSGAQTQAAGFFVPALDANYPLIDKVISRPYSNSFDMIQSDANADAELYGFPPVVATIPILSDGPPSGSAAELTDIGLGDEIRVMGEADDQFPAGIDTMMRIVAHQTSVPDHGGPAVTALTLNKVPSIAPDAWFDADHPSPAPPAPPVPDAPTGLGAVSVGSPEVDLSWTPPAGTVFGYYVYENGGASPIATVVGTAYAATGLLASTLYSFQVAAYNNSGIGAQATVSITTPAGTPPGVPAGLSAVAASSSSISLSWTASSGSPTGYYIYRDGGSTPIATTAGTSFTDTHLHSSTSYTYTVASYSTGGTSAQSSSSSATTSAGTATPIFGFNAAVPGGIHAVDATLGLTKPIPALKYFNTGIPSSFAACLGNTGGSLPSGVTTPIICLKPALPMSAGDQAKLATIAAGAAAVCANPYICLWQEGETSAYSAATLKAAHALAYTISHAHGCKYVQCLTTYAALHGRMTPYVATQTGGGPLDLYGADTYPGNTTNTVTHVLDTFLAQLTAAVPAAPWGLTECNSMTDQGLVWTGGTQAQWFAGCWSYANANGAETFLAFFSNTQHVPWPPVAATITELGVIGTAAGL